MNLPPNYHMAALNLLMLLTLLLGFFFYKYVFPKKDIKPLYFLIIVSVLPVVSIFREGVYESGDFALHIYRAISFNEALHEGTFFPSWSRDLNAGFGYPIFIYIYSLPYYIISLFQSLGATYTFSMRVFLSLSFIFSGLSMYFLLKKLTRNSLAALAGSISYLFAPFHLIDLHFRVAIGELLSFILAPILFLTLINLKKSRKLVWVLLHSFLIGLFFQAHAAAAVFFIGLSGFYAFYLAFIEKGGVKFAIKYLLSLLLGIILASPAWIPRLTLSQYTWGSELIKGIPSFVNIQELLYSPWRYGFLFQGPEGELSSAIGYTQLLVLILSPFLLLSKSFKHLKNKSIFWILASLVIVFLMLEYSKPLYQTVMQPLSYMQFTYRLLLPLQFTIAIVTAFVALRFLKRQYVIYIFILISVGYTILNWGARGMIPEIDDSWLKGNLVNATRDAEGMIEANPIWLSPNKFSWLEYSPHEPLEIIEGKGETQIVKRTSTKHLYNVYLENQSTLLENTAYFPGWEMVSNGKSVKIKHQTSEYPGRMVFQLPQGLHHIKLTYSDIPILRFSKLLSALLFLLIFLYTLYCFFRNYSKKWQRRKSLFPLLSPHSTTKKQQSNSSKNAKRS